MLPRLSLNDRPQRCGINTILTRQRPSCRTIGMSRTNSYHIGLSQHRCGVLFPALDWEVLPSSKTDSPRVSTIPARCYPFKIGHPVVRLHSIYVIDFWSVAWIGDERLSDHAMNPCLNSPTDPAQAHN